MGREQGSGSDIEGRRGEARRGGRGGPSQQPPDELTADERLRRSYASILWAAIIASVVLHFAVFYLLPDFRAAEIVVRAGEIEAVELPPEIEIPPPPERIARPAAPVVADADIDEEITIAPTTFEENPVWELPPPPEEKESLADRPTFTPYTVKPAIRNRSEVQRALEASYPPLLKEAGIGGTVLVWFFIDEDGRVQNTLVRESSGHSSLDRAALEVAGVFRFTPALNRDKKVPVWIALPITFETIR